MTNLQGDELSRVDVYARMIERCQGTIGYMQYMNMKYQGLNKSSEQKRCGCWHSFGAFNGHVTPEQKKCNTL